MAGLWARCFACSVLCVHLVSVIVARYVIWSGSPMRGSGHESSCFLLVALQTFQLSWFDHETLVWEPTPSLPVLQLSGRAYLVVIPTLTFRPVGLTPDWGHVNANRLARATKLRFHFCFQFPFSIFISLQFHAFPYASLNIICSRVQITDTRKMTSVNILQNSKQSNSLILTARFRIWWQHRKSPLVTNQCCSYCDAHLCR